ncbi:MAG: Peptidyl-prolyl cis-trans isomerase (EC [uncultured Caballeronia sp.]|nr:MAG: Peptidyl-prolyl cis-trans isomerase (EC [uncultured Caballeronia sp.]
MGVAGRVRGGARISQNIAVVNGTPIPKSRVDALVAQRNSSFNRVSKTRRNCSRRPCVKSW